MEKLPTSSEVEKPKKIIWKKIKLAALATFLGLLSLEVTKAQEKIEDFENKMEQLKENSNASEKIIFLKVNKEGQDALLTNRPTKNWTSSDGSLITIGYESSDREKPIWINYQSNDYSQSFCDTDADGAVDRIVFNDEEKPHGNKRIKNFSYTFQGVDNLAKEAKIASSLIPKDITVFNFGKLGVEIVNFKDGESGYSNSEVITLRSQEIFTKIMLELAKDDVK